MMQYNDKTMKNNWVSESSLGFNCQTPSARSKLEVDFTFLRERYLVSGIKLQG